MSKMCIELRKRAHELKDKGWTMRHIDVSGVAIMSAVLRAQDGFDGGMVRAVFFFNI